MSSTFDSLRVEFPDPAMVALLKTKTPAERLEMAFAAHRMVRLRLAGHFKTLHLEWSDEQVQAAIAERFLRGTVWSDGDSLQIVEHAENEIAPLHLTARS